MKDSPFKTVNPGAGEEEITALENRFHFQMPQEMKDFYIKQNGAVFYPGAYLDPEGCQLRNFHPLGQQYQEHILTIDQLLEWQEMDDFIPMYYIPFCSDEANEFYYVRVDKEGYGEIHYIIDFPDNPVFDGVGLIAKNFSEFLKKIHFPAEN